VYRLGWRHAILISALAFGGAGGPAFPRDASAFDTSRDRSDLDRKLRFAAASGQLKYAAEALAQGAGVDHSDAWGMTPLMLAALRGHFKMARLLLGAGADPNLSTDRDLTALHFAAKNCAHPIVADLVAAGARVNAKSAYEQTALSAAAEQGCAKVVEAMIRMKGIDLDSADLSNRTALDYARENEVTGLDLESYDLIRARLHPAAPKARPSPEPKPALLGAVTP